MMGRMKSSKEIREYYTKTTGNDWYFIDNDGDKTFTRAYIIWLELRVGKGRLK